MLTTQFEIALFYLIMLFSILFLFCFSTETQLKMYIWIVFILFAINFNNIALITFLWRYYKRLASPLATYAPILSLLVTYSVLLIYVSVVTCNTPIIITYKFFYYFLVLNCIVNGLLYAYVNSKDIEMNSSTLVYRSLFISIMLILYLVFQMSLYSNYFLLTN
jgi:hypothetical protein